MRHDWSHALSITLRFSPSHTALFTAREAGYRLARNKSCDLCTCGCSSQCRCTPGLQASRPRCGGHGASSLTPIMTCALWGDLCSLQRRPNGARNLDAIHGAKRLKCWCCLFASALRIREWQSINTVMPKPGKRSSTLAWLTSAAQHDRWLRTGLPWKAVENPSVASARQAELG